MMIRRVGATVCSTLAVVGTFVVGARIAHADDSDVAQDLLDRSFDAAADHEFGGKVVVEWRADGRVHERTIPVEAEAGVLRLGADRLVGAGARRMLRTDSGWRLLWASGPSGSAARPDPTRKYRFVVTDGATVAGRPATRVAIARSGSDGPRERLFFDDATGMLLRRDQLEASGRLVRRFAFVQLSEPQPVGTASTNALPKVSSDASEGTPRALDEMPDNLRAPKRIGRGFVLSGIYSQPDGSVQLYYSDGLFGLSVFQSEGALAWDELPAGGDDVELGGVRARAYRTAAGSAVIWESDDVTYTCVTDASFSEVVAIADALSSKQPGVLEDVARFVTAPFSWG